MTKGIIIKPMQLKRRILFLMILALSQMGYGQLIPAPTQKEMKMGRFTFDQEVGIKFENQDLGRLAHYFQQKVEKLSGRRVVINGKSNKNIVFRVEDKIDLPEEGYQLKVSEREVEISASDYRGVFYGIQTILQYLPSIRTNEVLAIPAMNIIDKPAFSWRGMMLDVSRHFFSVETIKEVLDLMAFYKLNTFHWHLTDNEGWRLDIKKYPKLTSIGAWRQEIPGSVIYKPDSTYEKPLTGKPYQYGGYYTQEQVKEVVQYAKDLNITVIPEIEMPGHSAAALAAYPEFSCVKIKQDPPGSNLWDGVTDTERMAFNYCPGEDAPFHFLEDILTEVMEMFPSQYIHIGGDEVDKSHWKNCASCQARIREEGLKDVEGLQSYFIKRIEKFLNNNGRKLLGWDEILQGGLAPEATVMSWRGENGGIAAAKSGHDVVMAPNDPLYFNRYQDTPESQPRAGAASINSLERVYVYNPIPEALNVEESKHVLGSQFAVWTEFISSVEHLEYMLLPRMAAFSEALWSNPKQRDFEDFKKRLNKGHYSRWKNNGIRFYGEYYERSQY